MRNIFISIKNILSGRKDDLPNDKLHNPKEEEQIDQLMDRIGRLSRDDQYSVDQLIDKLLARKKDRKKK